MTSQSEGNRAHALSHPSFGAFNCGFIRWMMNPGLRLRLKAECIAAVRCG